MPMAPDREHAACDQSYTSRLAHDGCVSFNERSYGMLAGMNIHPKWIVLLSVLAVTRMALADPPATEKPKQPAAATGAGGQAASDRKALMRQFRDEREKEVRERGEIFARITTKHDYSGEYVLFRDQEVTAFLDLKDPRHPRYSAKPGHDDEGPAASSKRRSHILVVPNQPRETIGKTLASDITAADLEVTQRVMRAAAALATRLGIKDPKIYVKSPARVGIGYLHVHVQGERDPNVPYPPPLQ
jgi:diadenosine tetraphosphate (Ap4A) HIT family hydrolase